MMPCHDLSLSSSTTLVIALFESGEMLLLTWFTRSWYVEVRLDGIAVVVVAAAAGSFGT